MTFKQDIVSSNNLHVDYPILLGLANYHRNYNILLFLYFKPTLVVTILAVEHQKYFNW